MPLPERLLELASRMHPQAEGKTLLSEAANEIDRLRAEVSLVKKTLYKAERRIAVFIAHSKNS